MFAIKIVFAFAPLQPSKLCLGNELSLKLSAPKDDFWDLQKKLAKDLSSSREKSLKEEQMEKYRERAGLFLGDIVYFSVLIFSALWCFSSSVFTPISYSFGAFCGLAYSYGLSKYVESLGGSAEAQESLEAAGLGQARFAFLGLLFILVGKFRTVGLQEIPAILGFFTYQLASLSQALREFEE